MQFVNQKRTCVRCRKPFEEVVEVVSIAEEVPVEVDGPLLPLRKGAFTFWASVLIIALRLRRGWSQAVMARRIGGPRQWVNKLENGNAEPDLRTLMRYASALGIEWIRFVRMTEFLVTGQ